MSDSAGAAKRLRDRRLQAWHRHVRATVAMELATALHHSAQRVEGPSEGEVHAKHDGPRAQKRPLPGTRPAPLAEVSGPQVRAATVGYVAARPPLIWWGPKLLADSSAEAIDGRTLRYLLKMNLARKEEEEEERRRRAQFSSSRSLRRKRKKKRKKRLPRTCGRARHRQRQWHAPGWFFSVPFLRGQA